MANNARATNILTPEFRGSFVHLYEFENDPATNQPSTKHSITMLFPKRTGDWTQDLPWLFANVCEALQGRYPGYQGMPPALSDTVAKGESGPYPVTDGDVPNRKGNIQEAHRGHWVVTARSTMFDPNVNLIKINNQGQAEIASRAEAYSGSYFEAQVNCFYYDKGGNFGVAVGLNNVKLVRAGEPLGGGGGNAANAWGVEAAQVAAGAAFAPGAGAPAAGFPAPPPVAAPPNPAFPQAPAPGSVAPPQQAPAPPN